MSVRDKIITFRVNEEEYKAIEKNKPDFEDVSKYIRRILLNEQSNTKK